MLCLLVFTTSRISTFVVEKNPSWAFRRLRRLQPLCVLLCLTGTEAVISRPQGCEIGELVKSPPNTLAALSFHSPRDSQGIMDSAEKYRRRIGFWRCTTAVLVVALLAVVAALVAVVLVKNKEIQANTLMSQPCPPQDGGLLTSGDPESPSPFHDITSAEYSKMFSYLRSIPKLSLADPSRAGINTSNIFMADLLVPPKGDVIKFLDGTGPQPPREARVLVFRGDKAPPVVEEYRVGPLSNPNYHKLISNPVRRNPVQFAYRPVGFVEYYTVVEYIMKQVDQEVGFILEESYEAKFTDCGDKCLSTYPTPVGSALLKKAARKFWLWGNYPAEYYSLHPLDFGVLANVDGSNPSLWKIEKVWYAGAMYGSLTELAARYRDSSNPINKTKVSFVSTSRNLYSTQNLRGNPVPTTPKRPPVQVEPDGKRYTIKHRHVNYLQWDFDIRLSAFNGPQAYDIRFNGERLVYELGLSEISVYYSGNNPIQKVTDFVDSGALLGIHSKSLVAGADCPEGATFLNASFLSERMAAATELVQATCVFEQNTAMPLRRHMSYGVGEGAFYSGMASSVLVVRSILTVINYDYILDFVFYQSGALEVRVHSTGYILSTFYRPQEAPYGFRLAENINGNIHHHMFHFKADIDILGTSNRYETLDISTETVPLSQVGPDRKYTQTRFSRHLRRSELDALYNYNFDFPKYHLVYNEGQNTKYGVPRAFRIHQSGMSKQLLPKNVDNEATIPWARQQLAVTVRKDQEQFSSSPYAMFDSLDPVVNFANFYNDNETIVDQDLVFWLTIGTHHIPHTEDLPVTPTPGGTLGFFLLPYNYFPECPSVSSRDNIRVEYVTAGHPEDGLRVERNGNKANSACGARTLEDVARERPDDLLQTNRDFQFL